MERVVVVRDVRRRRPAQQDHEPVGQDHLGQPLHRHHLRRNPRQPHGPLDHRRYQFFNLAINAHWAVSYEFREKREKRKNQIFKIENDSVVKLPLLQLIHELKYLLKWQKVAAKIWQECRTGIHTSKYVDLNAAQ